MARVLAFESSSFMVRRKWVRHSVIVTVTPMYTVKTTDAPITTHFQSKRARLHASVTAPGPKGPGLPDPKELPDPNGSGLSVVVVVTVLMPVMVVMAVVVVRMIVVMMPVMVMRVMVTSRR